MLSYRNNLALRGFGELNRHFSDFGLLRREFDRMFTGYERGGASPTARVTAQETGTALVFRLEAPGWKEEELDITVEGRSLTVRGQREVTPPAGYSVHRQERDAVQFAQRFALPSEVDAGKASAKLDHGVLKVTLPKAEQAQSRHIPVQSS